MKTINQKNLIKSVISILAVLSIAAITMVNPINSVYAAEFRNGETVTVDADEVIDGMLFATGNTVVINGQIAGDVICAGRDITITATVDGDIICAGQNLTIDTDAIILGDIRAAGQNLDLSGLVERNMTLAGQRININNAQVDGEVSAAAQDIIQSGLIGSGLYAAAQKLTINGQVDREAKAMVENMVLGPKSFINGSLNYVSQSELTRPESARISGKITRSRPENYARGDMPKVGSSFARGLSVAGFFMIFFWIGLSLLMVILFPDLFKRTNQVLSVRPVYTAVVGIFSLIVTPVVLIFIMMTIIGIPLSLFGFMIFMILVLVSRIFIAVYAGTKIADRLKVKGDNYLAWSALIGVLVLWIVFKIPVLGAIANMLAVLLGMGSFFLAFKNRNA